VATGDPFDEFYKQLSQIKDFHRRYPNEPIENLERAYKKRIPVEGESASSEVDKKFTGEEAFGRFFDLTSLHESYLNLPGIRGGRRLTYLQYLDAFDTFTPPQCPVKRPEKLKDEYFQYVGDLASYLRGFMERTKPLEDLDKIFTSFDKEFEEAWEKDEVPGWGQETRVVGPKGPATQGSGEGIWCPDCEKEFKNENVYKGHLSGKKHIKAAEARKSNSETNGTNGQTHGAGLGQQSRLKERAVAEREFRAHRLASAMQTERSDTKVNVERRQGMTERERQQELEALYAEAAIPSGQAAEEESDGEGEDKVYNPLKLPLAWDGKPIPFWLYKLHGLGVEFPCEICGNFVYMGRRAFDKHFNEARHIYGLKCEYLVHVTCFYLMLTLSLGLGVTNTTLFREITGIEEAQKLWTKIQRDKKKEKATTENVVQMEDGEGNVMPEKVYYDLQKQGLV